MCGRFGFVMPKAQAMEAFALAEAQDYQPRRNLAPTMEIPVILPSPTGRVLRCMHWGLVPSWAKDRRMAARLINARSETVADKPAFRAAFRHRRCLIPATCFYEWKPQPHGPKQPYAFALADGAPMTLAGVWEQWTDPGPSLLADETFFSAAILTTSANALLAPVHDRMPVLLPPEARDAWLNPSTSLEHLRDLLVPYAAEAMHISPAGLGVNRPGNEEF